MESSVIINTLAGEVRLPRLYPSEFIELAAILGRTRKAAALENARTAGLGPNEIARLLNQFDARLIRYGDVLQFILTLEGQAQVLRLALAHVKPSATLADVDALGIEPAQWLAVAAQLANLKLECGRAEEAGGAGPFAVGGGIDQEPSPTATGDGKPI